MDDEPEAHSVLIRFEAQEEIQEAYQWYDSKARKLGQDFLHALDERFASIERNPTAYPTIYKNVIQERSPDALEAISLQLVLHYRGSDRYRSSVLSRQP